MCTCSQKSCYATIYDLYKVQQSIYLAVQNKYTGYIISIYSVKTVTRSNTDKHQFPTVAPSTQPNTGINKYNFSWFTWYIICCKKIDPGNMGQLIQY